MGEAGAAPITSQGDSQMSEKDNAEHGSETAAERRPEGREDVRVEELDDGIVLQGADDQSVHVLNATAALMWELCDGQHTVKGIAAAVAEATERGCWDILADVEQVIAELRQKEMLK